MSTVEVWKLSKDPWGVSRLHGGFSFLFQAAKGDVLQPADPWLLRWAEGMKPRCCPVEIPQTRWWGFQYLGLWLNIPFLRTNALSKTPQKGRTNFSEESLHVFYAVSCKMWRCFITHDWFLPYISIYIYTHCIYIYVYCDWYIVAVTSFSISSSIDFTSVSTTALGAPFSGGRVVDLVP